MAVSSTEVKLLCGQLQVPVVCVLCILLTVIKTPGQLVCLPQYYTLRRMFGLTNNKETRGDSG